MDAFGKIAAVGFALAAVGQQVMAVEDEIGEANQADDDAHLAKLEHRHALSARVLNQTVNNEVCARANQGTDAAKNCCITQRD